MRTCGNCSLCCKLPAVGELAKPSWEWCHFCTTHQACDIYAERPTSCREYDCLWLSNPALPDELRPDKCKVVFEPLKLSRICLAMVDQGRPDAWKKKIVLKAIQKMVREGVTVIFSRKGMTPIYIMPPGRSANEVQQDLMREMQAQAAG